MTDGHTDTISAGMWPEIRGCLCMGPSCTATKLAVKHVMLLSIISHDCRTLPSSQAMLQAPHGLEVRRGSEGATQDSWAVCPFEGPQC